MLAHDHQYVDNQDILDKKIDHVWIKMLCQICKKNEIEVYKLILKHVSIVG